MKTIYCKRCGNTIENGYGVSPTNSDICDMCYIEEKEKLRDEI